MTIAEDIVNAAMQKDAVGVQTAVHTAMTDKITAALEAKKIDIARNLVGRKEEVTESVETLDEKKMSNHAIAVKAHKGENVGHGNFGKVAAKAAKEYGSKEAGEKVAAAAMWKKYGHKK